MLSINIEITKMATGFTIRDGRSYADVSKISKGVEKAFDPLWDPTKKPPSLEGTKYSRYGSRAAGIGSILDSEIVSRNIKREKDNLGAGFVQLQIKDDTKKNLPLNMGGRLHYADKDGTFTIIDEKYLEIMKQRETEKREYIEGIIQTCIMSDEICATILGVDEVGLQAILGAQGAEGKNYGVPTSGPLFDVDATPSAIETYAESSQAYSNAVQKFKIVIKNKMPIISELTTQKQINED